jgi:hypothetical protein
MNSACISLPFNDRTVEFWLDARGSPLSAVDEA